MAKIESVGLEDVRRKFSDRAASIDTVVADILNAGASVMADELKQSCTRHKLVKTGSMLKSIRPTKIKKTNGNTYIEVYPQGKDKKGIRNVEKAFVLNYGRRRRKPFPPIRWIDEAKILCGDKIRKAYTEVLEEHLK